MRETTGTTWTFQIIIILILIFACFLTLVLNYSKTYLVKNEALTITEKYEGLTVYNFDILVNYLSQHGYKNKGNCPDDGSWFGLAEYSADLEPAQEGSSYLFCVREVDTTKYVYYNYIFFYKFSLPFLGNIATFQVHGRTATFVGSDERLTN